MTDIAPFIVTHHDEASSWQESPVLRSLVRMTVIITAVDGNIFDGEIRSINEDGTITLTNSTVGNPWKEITIDLTRVAKIHYC